MQKSPWFLCVFIILPAIQFADVANELLSRERGGNKETVYYQETESSLASRLLETSHNIGEKPGAEPGFKHGMGRSRRQQSYMIKYVHAKSRRA
jgi:hypothetical protein